ncbi:hypothetical protein R3P38DRAFT_3037768, partial [Favolaschia claudopus]
MASLSFMILILSSGGDMAAILGSLQKAGDRQSPSPRNEVILPVALHAQCIMHAGMYYSSAVSAENLKAMASS